MYLNIVELILNEFKTTSEEHQMIKLCLETHKTDCDYYILNSIKYKEIVVCLKSIYHSIKLDLLSDICRKVHS